MAAPNLLSLTTIVGKTVLYNCTSSLASALSNTASSGKVYKINLVRGANIDTSNSINIDLTVYRNSAHTYISYSLSVPVNSSVILISKDDGIYLEEGDAIYAKASTTGKIDLVISYEDIS